MWLPRLLSVSSTVRVTRSSASMMVQGASKAIGQCQSSAAKPRRSHLKLLRCSLGWWVWGPEVVGGSFSPSKEKEDRGLISQGRSPIRVRAPNFMRIPMKRPPNRLCVSNMAVYFTWVQAGWVRKESAKGGGLSLVLISLGIGSGGRSNVCGQGVDLTKYILKVGGELQRTFLRVGEITKYIDRLGWGRNKLQWWNVIS